MSKPVYGFTASAPRITTKAIWLVVAFVGLPLLAGLVLLDVAVWLVFDAVWNVCVGLWCWL